MNTFELSLDLDKSVGAKQWITLRQGDKRGTTLRATLYDHGVLVSGSYTCRVSIRHPNRNTYYRETATYSNGVATVTIDETSAASVVGVTEGYFELLQGSAVIASTESFGVRVLQSATDGATVGPPYDSAIRDALDELDAATGRISQMVVDATAEYLAAHPEITTTVQDNSVTDAKLIQKGGVLDRVGRLWWRLENLLTATPAEAESVTVTDAAKTPVAGLTVFGKSTQDGTPTPDSPVPISSVTENLYDYSDATVRVNAGVTWTPQPDGTIKATGTATGTSFGLNTPTEADKGKSFFFHVQAGVTYTATSFGEVNFNVYRRKLDGTADTYIGFSKDDKTFTMDEECWVQLGPRVSTGTVTNTTYRIALVEGTKAASAYVPRGNIGLWSHTRNLLKITAPSKTQTGITYTVNEDKSVTVSGTATANTYFYPLGGDAANTLYLPDGTYHVSGIPSGASAGGHSLVMREVSTARWVTLTGDANISGGSYDNLAIRVMSGTTVNVTYRIQIEQGTTTHAYEPYAESVTALPVDGHALRSLPDGTRDEVTVDQYGHVTLVERVRVFGPSDQWALVDGGATNSHGITYIYKTTGLPSAMLDAGAQMIMAPVPKSSLLFADTTSRCVACNGNTVFYRFPSDGTPTLEEGLADMAAHNCEVLLPLKNPVTHDLGTIDPTALVGPDMTAQAVPTAPFALTYERDLNATLARLEAALATLA